VRVALLQGHVVVKPAPVLPRSGPLPSSARLEPGEQLVAEAGRPVRVARADVEELTSWREGRIRFDDTPLSEAVAEMNRYSNIRIVIEDEEAGRIRVSGAFRTGRSQDFAAAVASLFPIQAQEADGEIRLRSGT
jgi:transmembrane sensor